MKRRLKQLKALSAEERKILLSSSLLLPAVAAVLHLKGYKWTRAFLQQRIPAGNKPPAKNETPQDTLQTANGVARMVDIAARHGLYRANCLKRSLVTWWLLQRRGIAAELNIGVNKDDGDFNAHAWVEYGGCTLVEADNVTEKYSSFGPQ